MTETSTAPRMRTAAHHLSRAFLENGKFVTSPFSPEVTRHFPYSKNFITSLEDLRFLEAPECISNANFQSLFSTLGEPAGVTPFTSKMIGQILFPIKLSESLPGYSFKTPISTRIPGVNLTYHPTVGFDISCALFASLCQNGKYPWKIINVCEVVPSELICFSTLAPGSPSTKGIPYVIHFWINKWLPQGIGESSLPHIGVEGGATYSLLSRVVSLLDFQLDLTGVIYVKLATQNEGIFEVVPLNPSLGKMLFSGGERALSSLYDYLNSDVRHTAAHREGYVTTSGSRSSREMAMGIAALLRLPALGLSGGGPFSSSSYLASRWLTGENPIDPHKTTPNIKEHAARMVETLSSRDDLNIKALMWRVCRAENVLSLENALSSEEEKPASSEKVFLHWKDPEVKDFWLSKKISPRTLRDLRSCSLTSPQVAADCWRDLAEKSKPTLAGGDWGDLVQHSALSNLRALVT